MSFSQQLNSAVNQIFPKKVVKIHNSDKPWLTPILKQLIIERQKAFYSGENDLWRFYLRKVRNEISSRKRSFYSNKVQNLKSSNPRKWWDCINQISGKKEQSSRTINFVKEGVSVKGKDLARLLNDHFASVHADLPRLDLCTLPAYFLSPCLQPTITLGLKLLCNSNFLNFSAFSEIDCHILFTVTCHGTLSDIKIVMQMTLLKNIILLQSNLKQGV